MKKIKTKAKYIALSVVLICTSFFAFALPIINNCPTATIFWGESCCQGSVVYNDLPEQVTVPFNKCCKYRFGFVSSCEITYLEPIIGL